MSDDMSRVDQYREAFFSPPLGSLAEEVRDLLTLMDVSLSRVIGDIALKYIGEQQRRVKGALMVADHESLVDESSTTKEAT